MFENGEFRRVQLKWHGPDIVSEDGADEIEILSIGQLVLPFIIFGLFLIVSIIPLMIECCHKKIKSFSEGNDGSRLGQLQAQFETWYSAKPAEFIPIKKDQPKNLYFA